MALKIVTGAHLPDVCNYLEHNEWQHTMLSSRFLNKNIPCLPPDAMVYMSVRNDAIVGVFLADKRGYILLSQNNDVDINMDIIEFCKISTKFYPPYCISGQPKSVKATTHVFNEITRSIDYHLMISDPRVPSYCEKESAFLIEQSDPADHKRLLALELRYQQEEVFDRKLTLKDKMGLSLLYMEKLKKCLAVHAIRKSDNNAVGKAEISNMGFRYGQLGGVYTHPSFRGKGIAGAMIPFLLKKIREEQRELALFVKKSNETAINLYSKLGLKNVGEFAIHYIR